MRHWEPWNNPSDMPTDPHVVWVLIGILALFVVSVLWERHLSGRSGPDAELDPEQEPDDNVW